MADLVDVESRMGRTEVLPLSCAHVRTCLGRAAREQGGDKRSQIRRESAEISSKRKGGQLGLEDGGVKGELTGGARTATADMADRPSAPD